MACNSSATTTFLLHPPVITAQEIASAELIKSSASSDAGFNEGDLTLNFTEEGASVFSALTAAAAAAAPPWNQVAIVVDGVVVSDPVVTQQIDGGSVVVTAAEPDPAWESLAAWLNAQAAS